ncbi:GMC family oxidoreductase [Mycobacterium sp. pR1184]|uniref:GMC family oxidoreductase n=1 Tax=Mycobacterium sp. pR1184 TaxID=3238981 RepID=UPI00351B8C87
MTSAPLVSPHSSFDYVIVGAGSAGCVVANRLSEDPSVQVLLLEAGPEDTQDAIRVPAIFSSLFGTEVDWDYRLEPQTHYQGSTTYPRGKTLGGSSSINLMVYIRGDRADFDGWSERGCAGWDYASVLPYFIKAENNSRLGEPLHGRSGPLYVEDRMFTHELSHYWISAASEWGLAATDDFNGASQIGSGAYQVSCHQGWRWSGADGYLRPALGRPNLTVRVNAQATRILVDRGRATGVSYVHDGAEATAYAAAEVILSGGTINSAQLLLLSGIGPADALRSLGIDVQADLPGVGENLHDHTMTPIVWGTQGSTDLLEMANPENLELWQNRRGGPFSSNGGEVGGFLSTAGDGMPNIQFIGGPTSFVDHGHFSPPLPNFTMNAAPTHPRSRGRLWLGYADPLKPPRIDPAYFSDPADVHDVIAGLSAAIEIAHQPSLRKFLKGMNLPAEENLDQRTLAAHARNWSQTEYHPVGTCAMGVDERAVVDPELKVRGIERLRVVDASVMPAIISGNTNAATVMIAEKGADLIKNSRHPNSETRC